MKVPEPSAAEPRLYTIPPSAPFLTVLARAILSGNLPLPNGAAPDRLQLPLTTIYLPTRRAARALRDAFLAESSGNTLLLPRIRTLGDPDEDAAIIFGAEDGLYDGAPGEAAIGQLPRRLALMRLILAWGSALRADFAAATFEGVPVLANTPARASHLAADLARLMDFIENEEIALGTLEEVVPEGFAAHWQVTVDFLKIVTETWPDHLHEQGLVSPVTRRNALMAEETARLAAHPPLHPVIAAGSTGTVPATARLLQVIASLPQGAVVLPGLDHTLDDDSWASLAKHPEHPQAGLADLLGRLGVKRRSVPYVAGSEPNALQRARLHLVSEVLRPADSTDRWENFLGADDLASDGRADIANALVGLNLVETATAHDEAEAIALMFRSCAEVPDKTAALVTPDRVLARRVAARLRGFGLVVDNSSGVPLTRTAPGAFLDLVLGAVESGFAPARLMALLKHPLTLLGRTPAAIREIARALERGAFREVYLGQGLSGVAKAIESIANEDKYARLRKDEREDVLRLVADLEAAFRPLTAVYGQQGQIAAAAMASAHSAVAEALALDRSGSSANLWAGDAGEALAVLVAELISKGESLRLVPSEYPSFYRSLLGGEVVRPRGVAHPRLFIWGPLEARLQQPDIVILGSLNEGVWPRPQQADPWLSRPVRETLGLPPPERRVGLAAHDFAQALGAGTVYLSRARKVDGVPTVPSRWLQRLLALVSAAKLEERLKAVEPWSQWASARDDIARFEPIKPPAPCPPVESRPAKLSVSRIERWIANPYEIFAREILGLKPYRPLGFEPDQSLRGQIVHAALHAFAERYPDTLPADVAASLTEIADEFFAKLGGSPRVEAFWRPHFQRFAGWFAATEPARRAGMVRTHTEVGGALDITSGMAFRLTARADRIDVHDGGDAVIYDYKTGSVPAESHVDELMSPQLPLEGAMLRAGGFADIPTRLRDLRYIKTTGKFTGGEERPACKGDANVPADEALAALHALVAKYADPEMPYEVKRRPGAAFKRLYKYDEYEQLARVKEWLTVEGEEEPR